jgi:hypothetical protein
MKMPEPKAGDFERCPPGNHLAVCYEVIDMGTQETVFQNEVKQQRKVWIGWETPHETMSDGRPFVIGKRYTLSGHEKGNLRKDLESWRGKAFADSDFGDNGFQIESVIGNACFLNVVHTEKDGKTYANIVSIASLPKGTVAPPLTNASTYVSLEPGEFDQAAFDSLSDRMKETVMASPEYKAIAGGKSEPKAAKKPAAQAPANQEEEAVESPF